MANIKILILQKNINLDLSKDQKLNISKAKADFLILPRFYPSSIKISDELEILEKKYLDRILEISEYHKGIILGGSIFRKLDDKMVESSPIVQEIRVIDYHNNKINGTINQYQIHGIESESIYILNGIRFAFLSGDEEKIPNIFEEIYKEKVDLVFISSSQILSENDFEKYKNDLNHYYELSKKFNLNIFKCNGIGYFNNIELSGRSFYSSPSGIKWKLGETENKSEIIKNISITVSDMI
jgi:hypothetical protein